MIRLIIAGSRDIDNYNQVVLLIEDALYRLKIDKENIGCILSGTCRGVDKCGEKWAKENNIEVCQYPARWSMFGKAAGPKRNAEMVEDADALIVIHYNDSKGSKDILKKAKNKELIVFDYVVQK